MNGEKKHLHEEELAGYVLRELASADELRVQAHLKDCWDCRYSIEKLTQLVSVMREDATVTVPADLSDSVIRLFPKIRPLIKSESAIEQVLAFLRFDRLVPVQGLRYAGRQMVRQLAFSAEAAEIKLSIATLESGLWQIDGIIIADRLALTVSFRSESQNFEAEVDDLGNFSFEGIGDGLYEMRATTADLVILFPPIDLEK